MGPWGLPFLDNILWMGQRNPAPPGMVEKCRKPINIMGCLPPFSPGDSDFAGPSTVCWRRAVWKGVTVWPIQCKRSSAGSGEVQAVDIRLMFGYGFSSTTLAARWISYDIRIFGEICWNEIQSSSCFIRSYPHVLLLISLCLPGLVNQQFANWKLP